MSAVEVSRVTPGSASITRMVTLSSVAGPLLSRSEASIEVVVPPSPSNGGKTSGTASIDPTWTISLSLSVTSSPGFGPQVPTTCASLTTSFASTSVSWTV